MAADIFHPRCWAEKVTQRVFLPRRPVRPIRSGTLVSARRVMVAAGLMIGAVVPGRATAAILAAAGVPDQAESLWERASSVAGHALDMLHEAAIDPALRAADAALASPRVEQAYRQVGQTVRSTAAFADESAWRPLSRAAKGALESPAAERFAVVASAAVDDAAVGVRRYVVDPSRAWLASMPTVSLGGGESGDPFEFVNRKTFALNHRLNSGILQPVTALYRRETPSGVKQGVQNFFANLREPLTIAASLLVGEIGDAGNATARFGINTTVGILGIYDPANGYGFARRPHDFEEVLCTYRIPAGPYLVLPLYGPATVRDAVGRVATVVAYFEAMGITVYVPYRVGDAVARSAAASGAGNPVAEAARNSYAAERLRYLAARAGDCGLRAASAATITRH